MKLICVGRNYADHISELQNERPEQPVIFLKPDSAIILKQHPFVIPEFSNDVHHEVEILVKIKKVGKYIDTKFASNYYDEIGLGIDFTARDLQAKLKQKGLPWEISKAFDGSALIGDFIDKHKLDINNTNFSLLVNGKIVQKGNTSKMLWNIDNLIAYISQFFTLKIGDIIFTGTPEGVAKVNPDDVLEGFIENNKMFRLNVK
jgi:2-keto-4-pentenoate hydratase/2-oxohepta-3-ene-1,7-dioic acid hydratase in catechol pathway